MVEKLKRGNKIHIFVCVNQREDTSKSFCSKHISQEQYSELKMWNRTNHFPKVLLTKTGCLGVCNPGGGVVAVYPSGNFYKGIENIDEIKKIIEDELKDIK
ncbi:MAG: (2Fe-2S) ferredoxin domain-containing protein [Nanoarchaeales archaeon]|nr:(2Fe-2S) ferredoxin domain-containing protein [Nanoarchaeales archaeon]